jgi:NADPH-dependent ferric siderophore reductase
VLTRRALLSVSPGQCSQLITHGECPSSIAGPVGPIPPGPAGPALVGPALDNLASVEPTETPAGPDLLVDAAARPVDVLTVRTVRDVTPAVRRVTLTASSAVVAAAGPSLSLLVPRVGDAAPRWPEVARDGRIVWPQGSHGVALRSYTARRQDPAAGELDVDFVLHGDGPAAAWAAAAAPGALLGVASAAPLGAEPAGWLLLAGDETALPGISRILAAAGPDTRGIALLEVAGHAEEQELPAPPGVELRWLHRDGTAPGESTLLVEAVAGLARPEGEDLFAWVGAESATVRAVRADLRGRWGLRRHQHHAIGYWRRGRAMAPAG